MSSLSTDRIERQVEINAPVRRVWQALTDHREFGEWFRVILEGPFVPGESTRGQVTYPGYEHLPFEVFVERLEPERYFSFRWHPSADGRAEPTTLVEFHLEPTEAGTRLRVTESGFDALPADRRDEAYRLNERGWTEQMDNIVRYVSSNV